jgi:hypothetical protein
VLVRQSVLQQVYQGWQQYLALLLPAAFLAGMSLDFMLRERVIWST